MRNVFLLFIVGMAFIATGCNSMDMINGSLGRSYRDGSFEAALAGQRVNNRYGVGYLKFANGVTKVCNRCTEQEFYNNFIPLTKTQVSSTVTQKSWNPS